MKRLMAVLLAIVLLAGAPTAEVLAWAGDGNQLDRMEEKLDRIAGDTQNILDALGVIAEGTLPAGATLMGYADKVGWNPWVVAAHSGLAVSQLDNLAAGTVLKHPTTREEMEVALKKGRELRKAYYANRKPNLKVNKIEAETVVTKKLEAELVTAKKIEAEKLSAKEAEIETLNAKLIKAQKIEADLIQAKKIEADLIQAKLIQAKKIEADLIVAKRIEAENLAAKNRAEAKAGTEAEARRRAEAEVRQLASQIGQRATRNPVGGGSINAMGIGGWTKIGEGRLDEYRVIYGEDAGARDLVTVKLWAPNQEVQIGVCNWTGTQERLQELLGKALIKARELTARVNSGNLPPCSVENCYMSVAW